MYVSVCKHTLTYTHTHAFIHLNTLTFIIVCLYIMFKWKATRIHFFCMDNYNIINNKKKLGEVDLGGNLRSLEVIKEYSMPFLSK